MLNLIMPLFSLLFLPKMSKLWWYMLPASLIMMSYSTLPHMLQFNSMMSLTKMSSLDLLSSTLIILTLWISGLMFQASTKIKINNLRPESFMLNVIALCVILIMCFSSSELFPFYIWFEASLIPTMLLIMMWGYQPERIQASIYLMLYTVVASLPLLVAIMMIKKTSYHYSLILPDILLPNTLNQHILWAILILAFLVKLPMFLAHLWLPKAHVEAPVAGSMILAAILLKLGGYGFMRITLMFPSMVKLLASIIISVAMIGAVSTSLICLRQPDLKSIIAYSSVGHMGLLCAGLMSNSTLGFYGTLTMMIAHGFSSSVLFCMANITYESTHTRMIALIKGTLMICPTMSMWWFLCLSANMAAPPTINLFSEILLITASINYSLLLAPTLMLLSFLTAAYSLFMYAAVNHGHSLLFLNPSSLISPHYNLLIIMHLYPTLLLIMCPTFIMG